MGPISRKLSSEDNRNFCVVIPVELYDFKPTDVLMYSNILKRSSNYPRLSRIDTGHSSQRMEPSGLPNGQSISKRKHPSLKRIEIENAVAVANAMLVRANEIFTNRCGIIDRR